MFGLDEKGIRGTRRLGNPLIMENVNRSIRKNHPIRISPSPACREKGLGDENIIKTSQLRFPEAPHGQGKEPRRVCQQHQYRLPN